MPAFRSINLRSGDIAEQLGTLLLQSVALVAPVPRTEDVGVDLVVTLIKKYNAKKYIAEDSFLVQVKSSSVTEIKFSGDEIRWLSNLHLPFFIASVDRKTSVIKLYSTHSLSDALVENPGRTEIVFKLDQDYVGDIGGSDASVDLPIGPVVITWSLDTIETNPGFINEFYTLMKAHVMFAKKSIETRRVGFVELATWKTGSAPSVYGSKIKLAKSSAVIDETSAPYFTTMLHNMIMGDDFFTMRSLYSLLEKKLEARGHFEEIDGKRQLIKWTAPGFDHLK